MAKPCVETRKESSVLKSTISFSNIRFLQESLTFPQVSTRLTNFLRGWRKAAQAAQIETDNRAAPDII